MSRRAGRRTSRTGQSCRDAQAANRAIFGLEGVVWSPGCQPCDAALCRNRCKSLHHRRPKMATHPPRDWSMMLRMDMPPHDVCYRAIATRDARFDGRLFTGVKTTGIYCRPICPARTPKRENVTFWPSAAAAQEAGFRPCLRCRPEISPDAAAWRGTSNTVSRALALIAEGGMDGDPLTAIVRAARRRRAPAAPPVRQASRRAAHRGGADPAASSSPSS